MRDDSSVSSRLGCVARHGAGGMTSPPAKAAFGKPPLAGALWSLFGVDSERAPTLRRREFDWDTG